MAATKTKKNRSAGTIQAWGPFEDNHYVTTPHGDYSLEAGKVLEFELIDKVDKETLQIVKVAMPVYRKATKAEIESSGVDLSRLQPSAAFRTTMDAKNPVQEMNITINGEGTFPGVIKQAPVPEAT